MKVPRHVVEARRERLAQLISQKRYLPVQELCRLLGVSEATARRDLAALEEDNKITRTYGGAFSEFNERFPSFHERQEQASEAKRKVARTAAQFLERGRSYFFDSGTTIFLLAEAFQQNPVIPVQIVTSNIPAGEILSSIPGVDVFLLAGQLLHRQSVLLGEMARRSLAFWKFDVAFLSAEAMNRDGIFNSQEAIVEQQLVAMKQSRRTIFCIDSSKLRRQAPHFLLPWSGVDLLLTDTSRARLRKAGIDLPDQRYQPVDAPPVWQVEKPGQTEEEESMPVHML